MEITIRVNGERITVSEADYVKAKTADLHEYGYTNLTESEVKSQLILLLAGKQWTNVIGAFIAGDQPQAA